MLLSSSTQSTGIFNISVSLSVNSRTSMICLLVEHRWRTSEKEWTVNLQLVWCVAQAKTVVHMFTDPVVVVMPMHYFLQASIVILISPEHIGLHTLPFVTSVWVLLSSLSFTASLYFSLLPFFPSLCVCTYMCASMSLSLFFSVFLPWHMVCLMNLGFIATQHPDIYTCTHKGFKNSNPPSSSYCQLTPGTEISSLGNHIQFLYGRCRFNVGPLLSQQVLFPNKSCSQDQIKVYYEKKYTTE